MKAGGAGLVAPPAVCAASGTEGKLIAISRPESSTRKEVLVGIVVMPAFYLF